MVRALAAFFVLIALPCGPALAGDEDTIPPEILKQMNPKIRSGQRPTITKIKQGDIWGLREKPKFNEDFVCLDFVPKELSSGQTQVLLNWIRGGHAKLLLVGIEIRIYATFLKPATLERSKRIATTLLRHPVNTDCKKVRFLTSLGLANLGSSGSVAAESDAGAICGKFSIGNGVVYFYDKPFGADARRWMLNYWHWALGLKVPGAADTGVSGAGSAAAAAERKKHDEVTLKNGDALSGTILTVTLEIKTSYAELTFKLRDVASIKIEGGNNRTDVLELRTGDRMSGVLKNRSVKIRLASGAETELNKDKIAAVTIRETVPQ